MITKDYQITLTEQTFHQSNIHLFNQDRTIITTATRQTNKHRGQQGDIYSYESYAVINKRLNKFKGLRIFYRGVNNAIIQSNKIPQTEYFVCSRGGLNNQQFICKYNLLMSHTLVNLNNDNSYMAKGLSFQNIVKINQQKDRLYLQNLKWNQQNFDIFNILPKNNTNFNIKKARNNYTLMDLAQLKQKMEDINNVTILNEAQVLLHIGCSNDYGVKNFQLKKFNVEQKEVVWHWKKLKSYEYLINNSLSINYNTFMNSTYNEAEHNLWLKVFDYRVHGPVLNLVTPNNNILLQSNKCMRFDFIYKFEQDYKFLSLLTNIGGAYGDLFQFDIRYPDHIELINNKEKDYIRHIKDMSYHNSKLLTIERQFKNYQCKNIKMCTYNLSI